MDYYLPKATSMQVAKRIKTCQNMSLLLDKFPPISAVDDSKGKSIWLKELLATSHIDETLTKHAYQRWLTMLKAVQATHFHARTAWRMVVGLGGNIILETDMTLHHLYGIPFIPASALKGMTRAYATKEETADGKETKDIQRIFGTDKQAGTVQFFDAMPFDGEVTFAIDIMNAHYSNYYQGKAAPTNDQKPNPVTFLTVEKTTFTFALAPRRPEAQADVKQALTWLQNALQLYGVGGKTSAGYGYFEQPTDSTTHPQSISEETTSHQSEELPSSKPVFDPDLGKAQSYIREIEAMKNVAGGINSYYQKWQILTSHEARILLAKAIVTKVRQAGREKKTREKAWYQELLAFLEELT